MSRFTVARSAAGFLFAAALGWSAEPVDFTGHWQLDATKSKPVGERTVSLDLQQEGPKVTFTRLFESREGKQGSATFSCAVGTNSCDFNDNGHKAKVSLWFNGPELVVLKTDGDKRDSMVEWHLKLDDQAKTLTISREVMEPTAQTEKLVFNKTEAVASR